MDALLKTWPEAVKEEDRYEYMPLHVACYRELLLEFMATVLKACPDAVKEKDIDCCTPLHWACFCGASFKVTTLLLNTWLSYNKNRAKSAIISLQSYFFNFTEDVKVLFSHLFALFKNKADNPSSNEIMDYFVHIEMWNGAKLVLDRHPAVIKSMGLDTKVVADLLSTVGQCCDLTTMWEVLCNEQDLLEGV
eukprot:15343712-Ditylum_brightwellii.AAC.1